MRTLIKNSPLENIVFREVLHKEELVGEEAT